jgi:hypothetical protein
MISKIEIGFIAAATTASVIGFTSEAAARSFGFAPMHMQMPTHTFGTSAASIGSPAWTRLHTVAPSQFHAPLPRPICSPDARVLSYGLTGPAAGPVRLDADGEWVFRRSHSQFPPEQQTQNSTGHQHSALVRRGTSGL